MNAYITSYFADSVNYKHKAVLALLQFNAIEHKFRLARKNQRSDK